jgi:hypothetical protein
VLEAGGIIADGAKDTILASLGDTRARLKPAS